MIIGRQIRAARALLKMSRDTLSKRSKVPLVTLQTFEAETADTMSSTIEKVESALVKAGIIFIEAQDGEGPGVKLRRPVKRAMR